MSEKISSPEKKTFIQLLHENRVILFSYLALITFALIELAVHGKGNLHLIINQWHTPFLDAAFIVITQFGNGWMVLLIFILLLFIRYGYALLHLAIQLTITLVVQFSKHVLFPGTLRPSAFFGDHSSLYTIKGYPLHHYFSFPSGHAATAFGIFILLLLLSRRQVFRYLWFLTAIITAWSRVYLSQHFLGDIVAGSVIGLTMAFILYHFYARWESVSLRNSIIKRSEKDHAKD